MQADKRRADLRLAATFAMALALSAAIFCALGVVNSVPVAAAAAPPPSPTPYSAVATPVHHDVSPPLASLQSSNYDFKSSSRGRDLGHKPLPTRGNGPIAAGSASPLAPSSSAPTPGINFDGVGVGLGSYTDCCAPPDPNASVGPNHIVETVNVSLAIFNKSGTLLYGPVSINTLWQGFGDGCEIDNDGDPTVVYDTTADRWLISQFAVHTTKYLNCVAVSQTPDPTGAYNRYSYLYTDFPDYPKFGVWPDAYYVTFNMFAGGSTFSGGTTCAYDRAKMLAGASATQQCFNVGVNWGGLLPSTLDGATAPPSGSPSFVLALDSNSTLAYWKFHTDWTTPANTTMTGPTFLSVQNYTSSCSTTSRGACIPQAGTSQKLESLADRLMYRFAYRNFGDHEALVVNHTTEVGSGSTLHSGVRWYEIRPDTSRNLSIFQQGTYAPDTNWRWMASAAMDRTGNIALGYSVSGSVHPQIHYTARLASDLAGTMSQGENVIIDGGGSQTNIGRWGDYTSMAVDPSDGCTFWYTNEYLKTSGSFNWSTRIATFSLPGCVTLRASPSTVNPGGTVTATWSGIPNPTGQDWIGFYKVGAPDSAYINWGYTNGTASGTLPFGLSASLSPGMYELRLFLNASQTHTATSSPITVQAASLSASPSTVNPGGTVTANWSGIPNPTGQDWIGFYSAGAPDSAYINWGYTSGAASGSLPFGLSASLSPGTYELRLFLNASQTHTATSGPISVQVPTVGASPSTISRGGTVTASWSGVANPTGQDWIGLYSPGAPDSAYLAWRYTSGTASGSLPFSIPTTLSPGTYELRLFLNSGQTHVAISATITVT